MSREARNERFVEKNVTYVLEQKGRVVIVEHVPARVGVESGERFFAPAIVERLQLKFCILPYQVTGYV